MVGGTGGNQGQEQRVNPGSHSDSLCCLKELSFTKWILSCPDMRFSRSLPFATENMASRGRPGQSGDILDFSSFRGKTIRHHAPPRP